MIVAQGTAELVASYTEALGTVGAVIVALFTQVYLVRRRRPALEVTLSVDLDDEDIVLLHRDPTPLEEERENRTSDDEGYIEYYLRVKVWAKARRKTARATQAVLVLASRPPERDSVTAKIPDGLFKWSGATYAEQIDIAPGTWRRLDVLRYRQGTADTTAILAPVLNRPGNTTNWPPSKRSQLNDSGTYKLDFVVSCDDAEPTFWRLTFVLDVPEQGAPRAATPAALAGRILDLRLEKVANPR